MRYLQVFKENLLEDIENLQESPDRLSLSLEGMREDIINENDPLRLKAKLEAYKMKKGFLRGEDKAEYLRDYRERQGLQDITNNDEVQNALANVDMTNLSSLQNLDPAVIDKLLEKLPKKYQFLKPVIATIAKQFLGNPQLIQSLLSQVGERVSEAKQSGKVQYVRPTSKGDQDRVDPSEPYPIK